MAALSVSASLLKCSVAHNNINTRSMAINTRSMAIKVGQMKKPSLQLQRRSFKLHAVDEEIELDEEYHIGMSLSAGIDRDLLRKYRADEYADKAPAEYNSAIEILSLGGFIDDALELKQCMEMKRIPLTTDTYCPIIIGICLQEKKVEVAMNLLKESKGKPGCEPNEYTYGAIIERMYLEKMDGRAVNLVRSMISDGLVPLEVTVAGLIKSLLSHKLFAMATELVHEILPPNIVYYKCLIEALERIDEAILAKNTLGLMQQRGVDPDYESYCNVAATCASKELFDDAFRVVKEMRSKGFPEVQERMDEINKGKGFPEVQERMDEINKGKKHSEFHEFINRVRAKLETSKGFREAPVEGEEA